MDNTLTNKKSFVDCHKQTGVDLLKIICIFLIVLSHVIYTIRTDNSYLDSQYDYVVNLNIATFDFQLIGLQILRSCGIFANNIFWICSCWYLIDSKKNNKQKWLFMLLLIWIVSSIIALICCFINNFSYPNDLFFRSFLPTITGHYWYLTCYLLIYPLHIFLNKIINCCNKKELFRLSFFSFLLYCIFCFAIDGLFFFSRLILFVVIYFVVSYVKIYLNDFSNNRKANIVISIISLLCYCAFHIILNVVGVHVTQLNDNMMTWSVVQDPFLIIGALSLFNIFRLWVFKKPIKIIGFFASLAMLVYLIHEQPILSQIYRPQIVNYVYELVNKGGIFIVVLISSMLIFFVTIIIAALFRLGPEKLIRLLSDKLFILCRSIYLKIENIMTKRN